jgi:hypothetical protein
MLANIATIENDALGMIRLPFEQVLAHKLL